MPSSTRRAFLKTIGCAALSATLPVCGPSRHGPNVILVITDDQGYGDLSCHGNPDLDTPHLDRLYQTSIRLTDFHVSPTCAPTRASLMTGRYNNRTGVWHTVMGRSLLRRDELTMAEVFSANGYRTGIFGKWHLGDNYPYRPQDRGFQRVLIHGGGGVGQTPDYWGNDYNNDTYYLDGRPEEYQGYCTDIWFDAAMDFIWKNRAKPFFCCLAPNAPHWPYKAPPPYEGFNGMIRNIDDNMGKLHSKLSEWKLEAGTILIFMTDNGTAEGSYSTGMRGKKGSEYDGGHRVPCFIRWPDGLFVGGEVSRLTAHIDILPTLIDLCGLRLPHPVDFDGSSLAPLLRDENANWPDRTIVVDSQRIEYPEKWRNCAVMTDMWRLVNGVELYDIKTDPGQTLDISKEHPDTVSRLRGSYEHWWRDISRSFDGICPIVLGSPKTNPAVLTCHDWHGGGTPPWNQTHIIEGQRRNGVWAVEIEREGDYRFELFRWPPECGAPVTSSVNGGRAIPAVRGRIRIAGFDRNAKLPAGAVSLDFILHLKPCQSTLETSFIAGNGRELCGAYYVRVTRIK